MGTRRYAFAAVVLLLLLLWFSQLLVPLFTAPLLTGDIVPVRREIKTARHATLLDTAAGSLSGQHVLVTGGAGYIGSHASLRLLEEGIRITILDNLSRGNRGAVTAVRAAAAQMGLPADMVRYVEADLGDLPVVEQVLRSSPAVTTVMHFAAVAFVGESVSQPLQYYRNITLNTLTLLQAMQAVGVHQLIYSSTCATYGNQPVPITEQTPTEPVSPYGRAKLFAENIIQDMQLSMRQAGTPFDAIVLRYFNVYGADPHGRVGESPRPELRHLGRISTACFDAATGLIPKLSIYGTDFATADKTCVRDYIHVSDLVDAHVKAMRRLGSGGRDVEVFNIAVGKGYSVREFVEACINVTGSAIQVEEHPRRPGDHAEVYADASKAMRELNWKPQFVDLKEGLRTAWEWRKNGGFETRKK